MENNLRKFFPALEQGFKLLTEDIDPTGALNGYVITYDSTAGKFIVAASGVSNTLTNAHIFVGNASNIATDVALSGDATISNAGVLTIANVAITTAKIANNAVDGTKIALASQVTGSIMYYNGTDWIQLAPGTTGQVLTIAGGVPTWA